jgi:hypothetical protein
MTGSLQQAVGSMSAGPDAHPLHPVVVTVRAGVPRVSQCRVEGDGYGFS